MDSLGALRGVLHAHTTESDGSDSLQDMAEATRKRGYAYLGLTDALCRRLNLGADAFLFGSADDVCGIPRLPAGDGAYSSLLLASSKRIGAHHGESYLREKSR